MTISEDYVEVDRELFCIFGARQSCSYFERDTCRQFSFSDCDMIIV